MVTIPCSLKFLPYRNKTRILFFNEELLMSEYQVEKQKVAITIFLIDGQTREGVIFLSPFSSFHSGPQTLHDLMSEEEPFVPFVGNDGNFY